MLHKWVNNYSDCELCNHDAHNCHFCGEPLDHESFDRSNNLHNAKFCRPDVFEHEEGPLCTWPYTGDFELDKKLGLPGCYWDHINNVLKDSL